MTTPFTPLTPLTLTLTLTLTYPFPTATRSCRCLPPKTGRTWGAQRKLGRGRGGFGHLLLLAHISQSVLGVVS